MKKKNIIYGVLVGVLSGIFVVFAFGGCDRDIVDSIQQESESCITADTATPPLQEEIESSVTTSTPEEVLPMSHTYPNLYYAAEKPDGYVFGVYARSGITPGAAIRIGIGHIPTVAVLTMPETPEDTISKDIRFTIPREVIEGRSRDSIEIRVEVIEDGGYRGFQSLSFDPYVEQPNPNPFQSSQDVSSEEAVVTAESRSWAAYSDGGVVHAMDLDRVITRIGGSSTPPISVHSQDFLPKSYFDEDGHFIQEEFEKEIVGVRFGASLDLYQGEYFGSKVALLAVGAPEADDGAGAVFVFWLSNGGLSLKAKLIPTNGQTRGFGSEVEFLDSELLRVWSNQAEESSYDIVPFEHIG